MSCSASSPTPASKSVGIYGTPGQKQQHLPAIAAGREKWAIGFTEPGGGTDVLGALRTTAVRADGGWVLNGQKTWSSMAHVADYILLLVRTTREVEKQYQGVSLLPNCVDAIAALFGAAKAGLYPVPVNARCKSLELAELIRHSRMRALFISPPDPASPAAPDFPGLLAEAFPALAGQDRTALALDDAPGLHQIVVLGKSAPPGFATEADFAAAGAGEPAGDLQRRRQLVRVRDPAVVMYTSGTAAEPKGALLSHEALIRFADGTRQTRFFLTPEDRIWTALPMFHIGGIAFSVAAIYAGAPGPI